jgi:hypothetical protein
MVDRTSEKERRVLAALSNGDALRWCDLTNSIGHKTLRNMVAKGLIKEIATGVGPYSKHLRWQKV